ncbi:hypothetical protein EYF80_051964 [Liparis tanakae]|uniref:Uncharacterized protein n=1 Tax=Liparis tanakae TaxID=230148 RepID=A0A4Z2FAH8_9TELE|nr:hypothetical protein EYF80_051964 [Liparis tanakae]
MSYGTALDVKPEEQENRRKEEKKKRRPERRLEGRTTDRRKTWLQTKEIPSEETEILRAVDAPAADSAERALRVPTDSGARDRISTTNRTGAKRRKQTNRKQSAGKKFLLDFLLVFKTPSAGNVASEPRRGSSHRAGRRAAVGGASSGSWRSPGSAAHRRRPISSISTKSHPSPAEDAQRGTLTLSFLNPQSRNSAPSGLLTPQPRLSRLRRVH